MFLETSAKTAFNVVEAFNLSAQLILQNMEKTGQKTVQENSMKLTGQGNQEKKNGCC